MKRKQVIEKSLTVREAYGQFQRYNLTKGLSNGTISYYESYSRVFFTFLKDTDQPLVSITKDTIDDYTLYGIRENTYRAINATLALADNMVRAMNDVSLFPNDVVLPSISNDMLRNIKLPQLNINSLIPVNPQFSAVMNGRSNGDAGSISPAVYD